MSQQVAAVLKKLERLKTSYGDDAAARKLALLRLLDGGRLPKASEVSRLHETLCWMRAYPDDEAVLKQVERMLSRFHRRPDLRRRRKALEDSGIAGTVMHFPFFQATAMWLGRRWGRYLTVDWDEFDQEGRLENMLQLMALYTETPALDEFSFEVRDWIKRMKGPRTTDGAFITHRLDRLGMNLFTREVFYETLELPLRLAPGPDTPARTREKYDAAPVTFQTSPLARSRPPMPEAAKQRPVSVRDLPLSEGRKLIELARAAMVSRSRDLDAFAYGDAGDVRLVDCGGGLQFVVNGVIPARRFLLEGLYGYLMLKNGVPVGYGTYTALFGSAEVAFTVFDTFRAGEAASMYCWSLAIGRHLFGFDSFVVDPYQLGEENDDAIKSGAWWFYQKLGYRPRKASLRSISERELAKMRHDPRRRSSAATLKKLASSPMFLHLGREREDVLQVLPLANVGLRVMQCVARRFGADREAATRICSQEAMRLLGVRPGRGWSAGERLAWQRWAPLIVLLPGLEQWGKAEKGALVEVVRAKGGPREGDYLLRFDQHRSLRGAIRRLAGTRD